MVEGALGQSLRGGVTVFGQNVLFQRAVVDSNADGNAPLAAGVRHGLDPVLVPNVARVDADFVDARGGGFQGQLVVEVDVGHQRDGNGLFDRRDQVMYRGHVGDGHAEDLTASLFQGLGLADASRDIRGGCTEHGLDGNGRAAADFYASGAHLL